MSYSLRHNPDIDCIVLTFEDMITIDSIREVAPQVARMCEETGCQCILNDISAVTIDVSFIEIFGSPEIMDKSNVSRSTKRALVVPSTFTDARFLETVTRNRGHNLMVFEDIEEVKQWLLRDP